jgi:hypothetical protein
MKKVLLLSSVDNSCYCGNLDTLDPNKTTTNWDVCKLNKPYLKVYLVNTISNVYNATASVGLKVDKYLLHDQKEKVYVGEPFTLDIKFDSNDENYIVSINYDDGTIKQVIGSKLVVYEFQNTGYNKINVTAVSLNNPEKRETVSFYISVIESVNTDPVYSVYLKTQQKNLTVQVTITKKLISIHSTHLLHLLHLLYLLYLL